MTHRPTGSGKSSMDLIEQEVLFRELGLKDGSVVLDLGCGVGNYSLAMSPLIGNGLIHAVDLWAEGIERLKSSLASREIENILAHVADVSKSIPVPDQTIDLCFLATVFHDLVRDGAHSGVLDEVVRSLKPDGRLAIVEFKKIDGPPGPPITVRLAPAVLDSILGSKGFRNINMKELGPYCYLAVFEYQAG